MCPEHDMLLGNEAVSDRLVLGGGVRSGGHHHHHHHIHHQRDLVEEGSTSGVSTINSTKSAKLLHDYHHSKYCSLIQDSLQATRAENLRYDLQLENI